MINRKKSKIIHLWLIGILLTIFSLSVNSQSITVTGLVTEVSGKPLRGAGVTVKGTNIGTVTGMDGKYYISLPDSNMVLVFVFKGFKTVEIPVNGKNVIDVELIELPKQGYKPFRVDVGFGWENYDFQNPIENGGPLLNLELKYAIFSNFSIGVKFETSGYSGDYYEGINYLQSYYEYINLFSYLMTFDWHLTNTTFRPFAGIGAGLYSIHPKYSDDGNNPENSYRELGNSANNFGFMLRTGFDIWHFRLSLAYNFAGYYKTIMPEYYEYYDYYSRYGYSDFYTYPTRKKTDYFSIIATIYFGGGKRK